MDERVHVYVCIKEKERERKKERKKELCVYTRVRRQV